MNRVRGILAFLVAATRVFAAEARPNFVVNLAEAQDWSNTSVTMDGRQQGKKRA